MYKCKECGAEYEVKPDYCDCGNDEFDMVNVAEQKNQETKIAEIKQEKFEEKSKPLPASANRTTFTPPPRKKLSFVEQYPSLSRMIKSVDPISFAIFCICLILSLYIVFCAWNPDTTVADIEHKTEETVPKNIPSIDKIWNNALPVVKREEPKTEEKVENIIKQIIPVQTQKKTEQVKTTAKQKVSVAPQKKTGTTNQTTQTTKTIKTTAVKNQSSVNTQEQARLAAEAAAKQKAEQERIAAEAAHLKKLQAEQSKKAAEEKARKEAADKQEYISYKAQLRNALGRKIDFTRVIGDGSCTVAFKIDSAGNLTNRSFAKQSTNNTLNDAVYAAIMATPSFNPPPAAYKNETLNLNIRFYNGNFEISLP